MFMVIMIFFANNFSFTSSTAAEYALEMFSNHASRIRSYIEDPSIGQEAVERIIDAAHALSLQRSQNQAIKKLSQQEQMQQAWQDAQPKIDEFTEINPPHRYEQPNLSKLPIQPERNLLEFISHYSPTLNDWQRDIVQIVDKEARYFIPQIETKIMNEGWASYWHHKILNNLELSHGLQLEFIVRHNQVLRPSRAESIPTTWALLCGMTLSGAGMRKKSGKREIQRKTSLQAEKKYLKSENQIEILLF